jgi:surface antigen
MSDTIYSKLISANDNCNNAKSCINKTPIVEYRPRTEIHFVPTTKTWTSLEGLYKGVYNHALLLFQQKNQAKISAYINEKYKTLTTNQERETFKKSIQDAKKEFDKLQKRLAELPSTKILKADHKLTPKNAFKGSLNGQCTWYAYGRVMELVASGHLSPEVGAKMKNAFMGASGRDAKNWSRSKAFLGNEKWLRPDEITEELIGRGGFLIVWDQPVKTGHVAFVEKIYRDAKGVVQLSYSQFNASADRKYSTFTQPLTQRGFYTTTGNLIFEKSSFKILAL